MIEVNYYPIYHFKDVLEKASENIIETEPHILMSVVKGLYSLRPGKKEN